MDYDEHVHLPSSVQVRLTHDRNQEMEDRKKVS